jgi:hypothetical protein
MFKVNYSGIKDRATQECIRQIVLQSERVENKVTKELVYPTEKIIGTVAGNVVTLKAGSAFQFYRAGDDFKQRVVLTDVVPSFTLTDSTRYYLYATENGYGISSFTPVRSELLQGWYLGDKRALLRFATDAAGNVVTSSLVAMTEKLMFEYYDTVGGVASLDITGLNSVRDGIYDFQFYPYVILDTGTYYVNMYCDDGAGTIDTTDANYITFKQNMGAIVSPTLYTNAGPSIYGILTIVGTVAFVNTKYTFWCTSNICGYTTTAYPYMMFGGHDPSGSATNITKLRLTTGYDYFNPDSDYRVYKR